LISSRYRAVVRTGRTTESHNFRRFSPPWGRRGRAWVLLNSKPPSLCSLLLFQQKSVSPFVLLVLVYLNGFQQEAFHLPGDICQCVNTFLVVTMGGGRWRDVPDIYCVEEKL
jgi:hypothetical protein